MISFVAAGLGVALLPQQIKRLPHQGVKFLPLQGRLTTESWAVWEGNNGKTGSLRMNPPPAEHLWTEQALI